MLSHLVTDFQPGYDQVTFAIGAAMAGWHSTVMLCYATPKEYLSLADAGDVSKSLIAYTIAADAALTVRQRPNARDRDEELDRARYAFDWSNQLKLSLYPERARKCHDETLPTDNYKQAEFCLVYGRKHCRMQNKSTADDLEGLEKDLAGQQTVAQV